MREFMPVLTTFSKLTLAFITSNFGWFLWIIFINISVLYVTLTQMPYFPRVPAKLDFFNYDKTMTIFNAKSAFVEVQGTSLNYKLQTAFENSLREIGAEIIQSANKQRPPTLSIKIAVPKDPNQGGMFYILLDVSDSHAEWEGKYDQVLFGLSSWVKSKLGEAILLASHPDYDQRGTSFFGTSSQDGVHKATSRVVAEIEKESISEHTVAIFGMTLSLGMMVGLNTASVIGLYLMNTGRFSRTMLAYGIPLWFYAIPRLMTFFIFYSIAASTNALCVLMMRPSWWERAATDVFEDNLQPLIFPYTVKVFLRSLYLYVQFGPRSIYAFTGLIAVELIPMSVTWGRFIDQHMVILPLISETMYMSLCLSGEPDAMTKFIPNMNMFCIAYTVSLLVCFCRASPSLLNPGKKFHTGLYMLELKLLSYMPECRKQRILPQTLSYVRKDYCNASLRLPTENSQEYYLEMHGVSFEDPNGNELRNFGLLAGKEAQIVCIVGLDELQGRVLTSILAGAVVGFDGSILIDGEAVRGPALREFITVCSCDYAVYDELSLEKNADVFLSKNLNLLTFEDFNRYITHFGLATKTLESFGSMTESEKRRATLAIAASNSTTCIVFEEPTNDLTTEDKIKFAQMLHKIKWFQKRLCIIITSDFEFAQFVADKVELYFPSGHLYSGPTFGLTVLTQLTGKLTITFGETTPILAVLLLCDRVNDRPLTVLKMNRFQLELLLQYPKEAYAPFLNHLDVSIEEFDVIDAEITRVPLSEHARLLAGLSALNPHLTNVFAPLEKLLFSRKISTTKTTPAHQYFMAIFHFFRLAYMHPTKGYIKLCLFGILMLQMFILGARPEDQAPFIDIAPCKADTGDQDFTFDLSTIFDKLSTVDQYTRTCTEMYTYDEVMKLRLRSKVKIKPTKNTVDVLRFFNRESLSYQVLQRAFTCKFMYTFYICAVIMFNFSVISENLKFHLNGPAISHSSVTPVNFFLLAPCWSGLILYLILYNYLLLVFNYGLLYMSFNGLSISFTYLMILFENAVVLAMYTVTILMILSKLVSGPDRLNLMFMSLMFFIFVCFNHVTHFNVITNTEIGEFFKIISVIINPSSALIDVQTSFIWRTIMKAVCDEIPGLGDCMYQCNDKSMCINWREFPDRTDFEKRNFLMVVIHGMVLPLLSWLRQKFDSKMFPPPEINEEQYRLVKQWNEMEKAKLKEAKAREGTSSSSGDETTLFEKMRTLPDNERVGTILIQDLWRVSRERYLLKDVCLCLEANKSLAIVGKSGSGKTLLMEILSNNDRWFEGQVQVGGVYLPTDKAIAGVGYCTQYDDLPDDATVQLYLEICLTARLIAPNLHRFHIEYFSNLLSMDSFLKREIRRLTRDERQITKIAASFIGIPEIVLIDDPLGNVSLDACVIITRAINILRKYRTFTMVMTLCSLDHFQLFEFDKVAILSDKGLSAVVSQNDLIRDNIGYFLKIHILDEEKRKRHDDTATKMRDSLKTQLSLIYTTVQLVLDTVETAEFYVRGMRRAVCDEENEDDDDNVDGITATLCNALDCNLEVYQGVMDGEQKMWYIVDRYEKEGNVPPPAAKKKKHKQ